MYDSFVVLVQYIYVPSSCSIRARGNQSSLYSGSVATLTTPLVVVVVVLLHDKLLISEVDRESTNGDSKTRKNVLKTVVARKLALVSPCISLSPRVGTHDFSGVVST